ncbi:hypothetical protein CEXT_372221 [Caerostris extrusa]|uniref:Uncharacterized protein n=1 Tax=Caerostris extrusa TaxID=172846 RepID=A0AAV4QD61_CAEEX|nr:hypothetical protein CEXT_372221 [Caerostris extrusa]
MECKWMDMDGKGMDWMKEPGMDGRNANGWKERNGMDGRNANGWNGMEQKGNRRREQYIHPKTAKNC